VVFNRDYTVTYSTCSEATIYLLQFSDFVRQKHNLHCVTYTLVHNFDMLADFQHSFTVVFPENLQQNYATPPTTP